MHGIETISQWKSLLENDQLLSHGGRRTSQRTPSTGASGDGGGHSRPGGEGSAPGYPLQALLWKLRLAHLSALGSDGVLLAGRRARPVWAGAYGRRSGDVDSPTRPPSLCALRICLSCGLTWE